MQIRINTTTCSAKLDYVMIPGPQEHGPKCLQVSPSPLLTSSWDKEKERDPLTGQSSFLFTQKSVRKIFMGTRAQAGNQHLLYVAETHCPGCPQRGRRKAEKDGRKRWPFSRSGCKMDLSGAQGWTRARAQGCGHEQGREVKR